jgi:hypothetical protein
MDNNNPVDPGIVDELRRRKVLRSTSIYAVVGWCMLQWSDMAFEDMGWPDWAVTLVLTAVVLGFPVAVALSWAFDITPTGVKRTDPKALPAGVRDFRSYIVDGTVVILLLTTIVMLVVEGRGP